MTTLQTSLHNFTRLFYQRFLFSLPSHFPQLHYRALSLFFPPQFSLSRPLSRPESFSSALRLRSLLSKTKPLDGRTCLPQKPRPQLSSVTHALYRRGRWAGAGGSTPFSAESWRTKTGVFEVQVREVLFGNLLRKIRKIRRFLLIALVQIFQEIKGNMCKVLSTVFCGQ